MNMPARDGTIPSLTIPEIVVLPAEIDLANAESTGRQLRTALRPGAVVIADMSATMFADSSAVRMLLVSADAAAASHGDLRIVIPSPQVLRILQVLGVDGMLRIFRTLDTALSGGRQAEPAASRGGRTGPRAGRTR